MTTLRFESVGLTDGRKLLYKELSFQVSDGQIGAVYGPSRTGKSSLLLLAAGHMKPTAGDVYWDGGAPNKRRVGLGPISDLTPLFDTLTVEEHLLFQARLHHVRSARARVAELLQQYQLQDVKKYRIKDVAHLEQFRIGLATALVHRPDLILIDEPERGLTNEEWETAYQDVRGLAEDGHAVLLTTVLEDVAERCDVIVKLPDGEVTTR